MTRDLYINLCGLSLVVTVEYEDYALCGVLGVRADGSKEPIKCDLKAFMEELEPELQAELDASLLNEKIFFAECALDDERGQLK